MNSNHKDALLCQPDRSDHQTILSNGYQSALSQHETPIQNTRGVPGSSAAESKQAATVLKKDGQQCKRRVSREKESPSDHPRLSSVHRKVPWVDQQQAERNRIINDLPGQSDQRIQAFLQENRTASDLSLKALSQRFHTWMKNNDVDWKIRADDLFCVQFARRAQALDQLWRSRDPTSIYTGDLREEADILPMGDRIPPPKHIMTTIASVIGEIDRMANTAQNAASGFSLASSVSINVSARQLLVLDGHG